MVDLTKKIQDLIESGYFDKAKNILEVEWGKDSENTLVLTLLALIYLKLGDLTKASEYVALSSSKLEERGDIDWFTYQILGDIHSTEGENKEAFDAYFQALVRNSYNKELMLRIKTVHDLELRDTMMAFFPITGLQTYAQQDNGKWIEIKLETTSTSMASPYIAELNNVHALGQSSALFSADMIYLADDQDYAETERSDIVSTTQFRNIFGFKKSQADDDADMILAAIPNQSLYIEECIILNSRASDNYYHWLIEVVPKWLLIESGAEYDSLPILVHGHMPDQHYVILQNLLGENRQVIRAGAGNRYTIGRAVVPSKLSKICFDPLPGIILSPDDVCYHPAAIAFLRDRFRTNSTIEPARKIYLSRRSSQLKKRKLLNQNEIETLFIKRGYEIVDMADLSFEQQVSLFESASHIAGVSGASFSNLVFANKNCHVILLAPSVANAEIIFENLARSIGINNFFPVLGDVDSTHNPITVHSDFTINPEILLTYLQDNHEKEESRNDE